MVTTTRMSLEDFLALPDIDERRLELIDGEVCEKMSPRWGHSRLAGILCRLLDEHGYAGVEPRAIIPRQGNRSPSSPLPDIAYYRDDPPAENEWMTRPPNVAVEIVSPGQTHAEMRAKVDLYLAFGVESVWVIDPQRSLVDVFEPDARRTLAGTDNLVSAAAPGFSLAVDELFALLRRKK